MKTTQKYLYFIGFVFIFFLSLVGSSQAAYINNSLQSGATASCSGGSGTCDYIKDNNETTAYGGSCFAQPSNFNTCSYSYTASVNFGKNIPIYKVEIINDAVRQNSVKIDLYFNGIWNEIANFSHPGDGSKVTWSLSGAWSNVSDIRVRASGGSSSQGLARHLTYELRAWGPEFNFTDIGLRIFDGAQTVAIAAEPLGTLTSPLRIFKNGNIYGIPLVDPTDPNASKIRIKTSAGTKALSLFKQIYSWENTTGDGNFGESCNNWLTRTGQQGVGIFPPRVEYVSQGQGYSGISENKCEYRGNPYWVEGSNWVYTDERDPNFTNINAKPVSFVDTEWEYVYTQIYR